MYQFTKHFTLEEARSFLPRLRYEINEIIELKHQLDSVGFDVHTRKYRPGFNPDTLTEFPDDFLQMMDILRTLELDGIIVKGIEEGLVDFPALRDNGEEVFLCWKLDEEDINYWHGLYAGYRGRQPVENF